MKITFPLLIFAILMISCGKENQESDHSACQKVEYDINFDLRFGDEVCFPNGNSFIVKAITDEFCCCNCLCFWAGELKVLIETTNQNGEKELLSFGSSTFNTTNHIFNNFKVSHIDYRYKNEANALPLCEGTYDPNEVTLTFKISPK